MTQKEKINELNERVFRLTGVLSTMMIFNARNVRITPEQSVIYGEYCNSLEITDEEFVGKLVGNNAKANTENLNTIKKAREDFFKNKL